MALNRAPLGSGESEPEERKGQRRKGAKGIQVRRGRTSAQVRGFAVVRGPGHARDMMQTGRFGERKERVGVGGRNRMREENWIASVSPGRFN